MIIITRAHQALTIILCCHKYFNNEKTGKGLKRMFDYLFLCGNQEDVKCLFRLKPIQWGHMLVSHTCYYAMAFWERALTIGENAFTILNLGVWLKIYFMIKRTPSIWVCQGAWQYELSFTTAIWRSLTLILHMGKPRQRAGLSDLPQARLAAHPISLDS